MPFATNPIIESYLRKIEESVTTLVLRNRRLCHSIETACFSNKATRYEWCEGSAKRRKVYRDNKDGWKDSIILSTSRSISLFCNSAMLTDVTPLPNAMEYHENRAAVLIQYCGLYLDFPVHYDPDGIVNEVSMVQLINGGYSIKIHSAGRVITATPNFRGGQALSFKEQGGVYVLESKERKAKATSPSPTRASSPGATVESYYSD